LEKNSLIFEVCSYREQGKKKAAILVFLSESFRKAKFELKQARN